MKFDLFLEAKKFTIYCDRDGVLTDFERGVEGLHRGTVEKLLRRGQPALWRVINQAGEDFWSDMPWMADGRELWKFISKLPHKIASTPSRSNASKSGKLKWCKEQLGNVEVILTSKKEEHANENSILIDDREKNIMKWKNEGGIGISHTSAKETIRELTQLLKGDQS